MKFSKIAAAAAALATAGMMTVPASAVLLPVKASEKAELLHDSNVASWMVVPFYDGVEPLDKGKPEGSIDGLDYSKIAKVSFTFSVAEVDRDFWDGMASGCVVFSVNGGDLGSGDHKSDKYDTYNWPNYGEWYGVEDADAGYTAAEDKPAKAVKVADYTYNVTIDVENPLANGDASEIGLMQIVFADYSNTALCQIQVDQLDLLDASGNVLITFDGKGEYTLGGGSSTPAPDSGSDKTDDTTPSTPSNVDTGVEGVAAVVGVAALAAGAVVLSRKRK